MLQSNTPSIKLGMISLDCNRNYKYRVQFFCYASTMVICELKEENAEGQEIKVLSSSLILAIKL